MRTNLTTCLAFSLAMSGMANAEEADPAIVGLEKAASSFVIAFNEKDADAISKLFTPDGEMADLSGEDLLSGRAEIKAHYEEVFSNENLPGMAVEVESVRLVAPNLAIEDGVAHFTPLEDDAPPRSIRYTATLLKDDDGKWHIASTRDLSDESSATAELFELSKILNGDWTCHIGGVRLDIAIGWEDSGKFLVGEMLTVSPDAEPQTGTIRIGWNAARKSVCSWMFDSRGGSRQSLWTPTEEGWLIRTEGTTADGETVTASQTITTEGDAIIWSSEHRVIDGVAEPGNSIRLTRRPPEPSVE